MCLLPAGTQDKFMCVCVRGGGGGGGVRTPFIFNCSRKVQPFRLPGIFRDPFVYCEMKYFIYSIIFYQLCIMSVSILFHHSISNCHQQLPHTVSDL